MSEGRGSCNHFQIRNMNVTFIFDNYGSNVVHDVEPSFAKASEWLLPFCSWHFRIMVVQALADKSDSMHYCYILLSLKSHIFYYGSTKNLKARIKFHNEGKVKSTMPHLPWKLVWYGRCLRGMIITRLNFCQFLSL